MNPGLLRGFPGDTRPRYLYAAEVIYSATLSLNGVFDTMDAWPSGIPDIYRCLEFTAELRSTAAGTSDICNLYLNGDTTDSNYAHERMGATNSGIAAARGDSPQAGETPASGSSAGDYSLLTGVINNPASTRNKTILTLSGSRRDATNHRYDGSHIAWESSNVIRRIQWRPDGYATDLWASGSSLRLVGYREVPLSELMA